ncbi:hypothetical protein FA09DRAFT_327329 [Tilletiopsis washingtonensis]|uniref:Cofilin n=1 Tax=Tilletiopsis washingtonensis TaxID=58919 RepID=A0A316ZK66_9BASI|nr:hypothetical protein FA09DRAFT_327329 [Tilletiopsis washingtonensis]PWO01403.1 hypothetical protein FA09DRAFT_327329 [Tilletiopsis washingtonensis]
MSSGVKVSSDCLAAYQQLKLGKSLRYILYGLSADKTEIVVLHTAPAQHDAAADYDAFLEKLPKDDCVWGVYDFEFTKGDEGKRNKICFISWAPDDAKIKAKMLAASSKDALRKALVGVAVEVQATDIDEVAYDAVLEKCSRGY